MALEVLSVINLDMAHPLVAVVNAKQYDTVRKIEAHLYNDGEKWYVPSSNIHIYAAYKKSDGVAGFYDVTELGQTAVTVNNSDRSIIYINLDRNVLTLPGNVTLEVVFVDVQTTARLSGFSFIVAVERSAVSETDLSDNPNFTLLARQMLAVINFDESVAGVQATATTLAAGSNATASVTGGTGVNDPYVIHIGVPRGNTGATGATGARGDDGVGITSVVPLDATGAPGHTDTYRVNLSNGTYTDFGVYNGTNGGGEGSISTVSGIQPTAGDVVLIIKGSGAPTSITSGIENQFYYNVLDSRFYICLGYDANDGFVWKLLKGTADLICNKNLLYNPWFQLNSRGFQNYVGVGTSPHYASDTATTHYVDKYDYTIDQWMTNGNDDSSLTVTDDGIGVYTITNNIIPAIIQELHPQERYYGKTVTLSAYIRTNTNNDYELVTSTGTIGSPRAGTTGGVNVCSLTFNGTVVAILYFANASGDMRVELRSNTTANSKTWFKAVKLEFGDVSTLENELPPDIHLEYMRSKHRKIDHLDFYSYAPEENPIKTAVISPSTGVSELYEVGKTWLEHANEICYAVPSILAYEPGTGPANVPIYRYANVNKFPMVCGTLGLMMLAGVPFDQSRCVSGSVNTISNVPTLVGGKNVPWSGKMVVDIFSKLFPYYQMAFTEQKQLYAPEFARLLDDAGLLHPVETDELTELCVGDLIFFGDIGSSSKQPAKRWERINHIELFLGWSGTVGRSLSTNSGATPSSSVYISSNTIADGVYYRSWTASTARTNAGSLLMYYARIPGSGFSSYRTINLLSKQYIGGTTATLPYTWNESSDAGKSLFLDTVGTIEANRAYTFIIETEQNNNNIQWSLRPVINGTTAGDTTSIDCSQKRFKVGRNLYACCFIPYANRVTASTAGSITAVWIKPACTASTWSVTIKRVWLYDKLVTP